MNGGKLTSFGLKTFEDQDCYKVESEMVILDSLNLAHLCSILS